VIDDRRRVPGLLVLRIGGRFASGAVVRDDLGVDLDRSSESAVEIGRAGVAVGDFRLHLRAACPGRPAQQTLLLAFGGEAVRHDRPADPRRHDDVNRSSSPPFSGP